MTHDKGTALGGKRLAPNLDAHRGKDKVRNLTTMKMYLMALILCLSISICQPASSPQPDAGPNHFFVSRFSLKPSPHNPLQLLPSIDQALCIPYNSYPIDLTQCQGQRSWREIFSYGDPTHFFYIRVTFPKGIKNPQFEFCGSAPIEEKHYEHHEEIYKTRNPLYITDEITRCGETFHLLPFVNKSIPPCDTYSPSQSPHIKPEESQIYEPITPPKTSQLCCQEERRAREIDAREIDAREIDAREIDALEKEIEDLDKKIKQKNTVHFSQKEIDALSLRLNNLKKIKYIKLRIKSIKKLKHFNTIMEDNDDLFAKKNVFLGKKEQLQELNKKVVLLQQELEKNTTPIDTSLPIIKEPITPTVSEEQPVPASISEEEKKAERKAAKKERLSQAKIAAAQQKATEEAIKQQEGENKKNQEKNPIATANSSKKNKLTKEKPRPTEEEILARKAAEEQEKIEAEHKKVQQRELDRQRQRERDEQKRAADKAKHAQEEEKKKAQETKNKAKKVEILQKYEGHVKEGRFREILNTDVLSQEEVETFKIKAANAYLDKHLLNQDATHADHQKIVQDIKEYLFKIASNTKYTKDQRTDACMGLTVFRENATLMLELYTIGKQLNNLKIMLMALNAPCHQTDDPNSSQAYSKKLTWLKTNYSEQELKENYLYFHSLYLEAIKREASYQEIKTILEEGLQCHPESDSLQKRLNLLTNSESTGSLKIFIGPRRRFDHQTGQSVSFKDLRCISQTEHLDELRKAVIKGIEEKTTDQEYLSLVRTFYYLISKTENTENDYIHCYNAALLFNDISLQLDSLYNMLPANLYDHNKQLYQNIKDKMTNLESTYGLKKAAEYREYFLIKHSLCELEHDHATATKFIEEGLKIFPENNFLQKLQETAPNDHDITCEQLYKKYSEARANNKFLWSTIRDAYQCLASCNNKSNLYTLHAPVIQKEYVKARYMHITLHSTDPLSTQTEQNDFLNLLKTFNTIPLRAPDTLSEKEQSENFSQLLKNLKVENLAIKHGLTSWNGSVQDFRIMQEILLRENNFQNSRQREEIVCKGLEIFPHDEILKMVSLDPSMPNADDQKAYRAYTAYQNKKIPAFLSTAKELLKSGNPHSLLHQDLKKLVQAEPSSSIT